MECALFYPMRNYTKRLCRNWWCAVQALIYTRWSMGYSWSGSCPVSASFVRQQHWVTTQVAKARGEHLFTLFHEISRLEWNVPKYFKTRLEPSRLRQAACLQTFDVIECLPDRPNAIRVTLEFFFGAYRRTRRIVPGQHSSSIAYMYFLI